MKLKLLTAGFDPAQGTFDDRALETFIAEHDVVDMQPQFFHYEGRPFWSVLVRYRGQGPDRRSSKDWRSTLDPDQQVVYDRISAWRREQSKTDGVAPFIILTNRQVAALVTAQPPTKAAMQKIDGLGKKTADKYGDPIIALLKNAPAAPAGQP